MLVAIAAIPETEVLIRKLDPMMNLLTEDFDGTNIFIFSPFENEPNQFIPLDVYADNYHLVNNTNELIGIVKEI